MPTRASIPQLFLIGVRFWAARSRHWLTFVRLWRMRRRAIRRRHAHEPNGLHVPGVLALSPTVECTLSCIGCYAAGHPRGNEVPIERIDTLLDEATDLGVFALVVTGGEPLLRDGLLDLLCAHGDLAVVLISNGSTLTSEAVSRIAAARHIVTLISLEGFRDHTDARRGPGVYDTAMAAMERLREAGALFGFAAVVTAENVDEVTGEPFIDAMLDRGCAIGFLTDYIPAGPDARWEWVVPPELKRTVRERVVRLRRTRPLALVQFPDDEYDADNRCRAAGRESLHINARGDVEPCPFTAWAAENVRDQSLADVLGSPFLAAIRDHPTLLRRDRLGCALFENRATLADVARAHGAASTEIGRATGPTDLRQNA